MIRVAVVIDDPCKRATPAAIAEAFVGALLRDVDHDVEWVEAEEALGFSEDRPAAKPARIAHALANCEILVLVVTAERHLEHGAASRALLAQVPPDALCGVTAIPILISPFPESHSPEPPRRLSSLLLDHGAAVLGRTITVTADESPAWERMLTLEAHAYRNALSHVGATAAVFPTTLIP